MKRALIALAVLAFPMFAQAIDVNVDLGDVRVQTPVGKVTFGSRDSRGYYWDGDEYRSPSYWREHDGPRGEKYYTGRHDNGVPHQGGGHCPPGQAKKGRC